MNNKHIITTIVIFALSLVACRTSNRIFGENYEMDISKFTGKALLMDNRLFILADVINTNFNKVDHQGLKTNEGYVLVNLHIYVRKIYVHKKFNRYIGYAPCLYQLTPVSKMVNDSIIVNYYIYNKKDSNLLKNNCRFGMNNCLLAVDKNFYLRKLGSLEMDFWKAVKVSMIAPYSTYSLDSLIVYDSFYNSWKKECDGGIY